MAELHLPLRGQTCNWRREATHRRSAWAIKAAGRTHSKCNYDCIFLSGSALLRRLSSRSIVHRFLFRSEKMLSYARSNMVQGSALPAWKTVCLLHE
jgi:hypothetical protein